MSTLDLAALFSGGAEAWEPLLAPTLTAAHDAHTFLSPTRAREIVPVRELTFQALKANPPSRVRVVVFGQSPYPRVESATGIAMFDNSFTDWSDAKFGKVTSIRCIVKAAAMREHGVPKATSTAELRALIAKNRVVPPAEWFQSMLVQGVLLLNASLTASTNDAISTTAHAAFWKPTVLRIVDGILSARRDEGVVFAWWGTHAKALRKEVERLAGKHPSARIVHVEHVNPAAQGDAFCDGDPFGDIDRALASLGLAKMSWLPQKGWHAAHDAADTARLGDFITETQELHKQYLERLAGAVDEVLLELAPITGIGALPQISLAEAVAPLEARLRGIASLVTHAQGIATKLRASSPTLFAHGLSADEVAAVHLYTLGSGFYKLLNEALRASDRKHASAYLPYLRHFLSALTKLRAAVQGSGVPSTPLYRGVHKDLRGEYAVGKTITWWGVSSCTPKLEIARQFLGGAGRRVLFEVHAPRAVSIRPFSAYAQEDELVLAPGTQLRVEQVIDRGGGLTGITLRELDAAPLVS